MVQALIQWVWSVVNNKTVLLRRMSGDTDAGGGKSTPKVSLESDSRWHLACPCPWSSWGFLTVAGHPWEGHSWEGSLIFLLPQFPLVVVTGHVLRELKQVSAGGECPSRPWRARAKSDLQLGGPENPAALPATCQGALALSGVLRRLQEVEEKVLQVKALLFALSLPCLCLGCLPFLPSLLLSRAGAVSHPAVCAEGHKPTWRPPRLSPHSVCLYLFFLSPFLPWLQKRAQNLANREFHKKNIKEKAAHLASMFGHGDFPQVNAGLSEPPGTQVLDIQGGYLNQSLEIHFFLPSPSIA